MKKGIRQNLTIGFGLTGIGLAMLFALFAFSACGPTRSMLSTFDCDDTIARSTIRCGTQIHGDNFFWEATGQTTSEQESMDFSSFSGVRSLGPINLSADTSSLSRFRFDTTITAGRFKIVLVQNGTVYTLLSIDFCSNCGTDCQNADEEECNSNCITKITSGFNMTRDFLVDRMSALTAQTDQAPPDNQFEGTFLVRIVGYRSSGSFTILWH